MNCPQPPVKCSIVAGSHDLDAVLTRLEAKVAALPTREWIRDMMVREVARTTALAAAVAVVGTLALGFVR